MRVADKVSRTPVNAAAGQHLKNQSETAPPTGPRPHFVLPCRSEPWPAGAGAVPPALYRELSVDSGERSGRPAAAAAAAAAARAGTGAAMTGISPSVAHFDCPGDPLAVQRNYFLLEEYRCFTDFFGEDKPRALTPAIGYLVVIAFGLLFGLFTVALIYLEHYIVGAGRRGNSEFFNTAGRETLTGLTASVLVSQWTWAATLLQSSTVAFKFGVSGPFWYASGASVQLLLFSLIAILVKLRAPTSHTFLEIIHARWGRTTHIIFICFALLTNVVITSLLVLGGSAVTSALTGIDRNLASFLIPLGVILYTLAGGLKATFMASWVNAATILVGLCLLTFRVYVTAPELGSVEEVWQRLVYVGGVAPVANNRDGSYLTMLSLDGLFFGMINVIGNFGTVFIDQAYWQSAIAATPSSAWPGYMLGGLTWFAIPFSLATALGLGSVALSLPLSADEVNQGLVVPAGAIHLMGRGGAVIVFVMVFSAVTSSGAAEMIAVSSIVAYDIYRTYIDPNCSGQRIIFVSRIAILTYGMLMGLLGIAFHSLNIDLNLMYNTMAIFISPALIPVIFSVSWGRASAKGASSGAILGLLLGTSVYFGYGNSFGGLTRENLSRERVQLAGGITSMLTSGIVCVLVSLYDPDDCDWSTTRAIALIEDDPNSRLTYETETELRAAFRKNMIIAVSVSLCILVVWPLLSMPAGTFSLSYFQFWVYVSMAWGLASTIILIALPLWESRRGVVAVLTFGKVVLPLRKDKDGIVRADEGESDDGFVADER
jgi:urea-proton symporter